MVPDWMRWNGVALCRVPAGVWLPMSVRNWDVLQMAVTYSTTVGNHLLNAFCSTWGTSEGASLLVSLSHSQVSAVRRCRTGQMVIGTLHRGQGSVCPGGTSISYCSRRQMPQKSWPHDGSLGSTMSGQPPQSFATPTYVYGSVNVSRQMEHSSWPSSWDRPL